ncbi:hypothetical protein [Clostridium sp.]|uniref:hypothetical protein n=1 Tax=Clostridium sp. TaxID=1506 RepID=UPI002607D83B|nr:hypothetical protein [Clostridium sp.]
MRREYRLFNITMLKLASFISSMFPFGIYMFIEYYNDYYRFWGMKYLTPSIWSKISLGICVISTIYVIFFYKKIINNIDCSIKYIRVSNLKKEKANTTNYLLANVLPIATISMDTELKALFVIFLLIILGFMYIKNNLYSTNPIYDIIRVKVYEGTVEILDLDNTSLILNKYDTTIISNEDIFEFKDNCYIAIEQEGSFFIKKKNEI